MMAWEWNQFINGVFFYEFPSLLRFSLILMNMQIMQNCIYDNEMKGQCLSFNLAQI